MQAASKFQRYLIVAAFLLTIQPTAAAKYSGGLRHGMPKGA